MSEELKSKLYNYEVNPPEETWNRIAAALDELPGTKISQELYNVEVTPPQDAWTKIALALDQASEPVLINTLYNVEVAPPPAAWDKIAQALDEEKDLPRIGSSKTTTTFLKYAAAAALVGVIAFAAFKFLNQTNSKRETAANKQQLPKNPEQSSTPGNQKDSISNATAALSNNLPKQGNALARNTASPKKRNNIQDAGYMTQRTYSASAITNASARSFQQVSLKGSIPGSHPVVSDRDRYMIFMNPQGYLIRISKKLAQSLGCYNTNRNSTEYQQCQEQIKQWRDKIAQTPGNTSPDNFMDILDILKSTEEEL